MPACRNCQPGDPCPKHEREAEARAEQSFSARDEEWAVRRAESRYERQMGWD